MSSETVVHLRERLASLQPLSIEIEDESHRHAGHAGAKDGGHYQVTIVSSAFSGKNTVARHRLVYDAAGDLMRGRIHALGIHAFAPGEV
ncbi:BolA/IbaG family iron-sulfur metabolism protein [Dechloromonas sp. TW-R-39-2]|uniref:BolA family protein n=1 Tax=Dechloromonas sp. TW-R-39-2 TaxID=2654218 RepID=UPI00193E12FD|nr:BolA family protein [Dechloromonas sp. TW-R-39-2]QRM19288.1 BolA/IbaG family iron-sulfur metabolism protein [Dechloromonas sp. TW-R-39-2]